MRNKYAFCVIFLFLIIAGRNANAQLWAIVGSPGFSPGVAYNTGMAIDRNNVPYVVFQDAANSYSVTAMKYNAGVWNTLGTPGFSPANASYPCIALSSKDTAFAAYIDGTNQSKVSVMKFNGTNWVYVGLPDFSDSAVMVTLALGTNDTAYVAFLDGIDSSRVTVMKYNGSTWVNVGAPAFSPLSDDISLAIDGTTGIPYVAFTDVPNGGNSTVMNYIGGNWNIVGVTDFSAGGAEYLSLVINKSSAPLLAYQDGANNNMASVMEYNGSSWINLGVAGFSKGTANYTSLALDSAGVPFVAYQDAAYGSAATVAEYNGSTWAAVGSPGCTAGTADYTSLTVDRHGRLYVAYQDGASSGFASIIIYQHCNTGSPTVIAKVNGMDTICPNINANISASGAINYAWSTGDSVSTTTPKLTGSDTTYEVYVTGIAANGCASTDSVKVYTKSNPVIAIGGKDSICLGDSTMLIASGAVSYAWNTGATTSSVTETPAIQTMYYITGTGSNGCIAKDSISVYVDTSCNAAGINEITFARQFILAPNPAHDNVYLTSNTDITNALIRIYDVLGEPVELMNISYLTTGSRYPINIGNLASGMYYFSITTDKVTKVYKIVKQ